MKQKTKENLGEQPARDECSHYWVIEIANGPTSIGRCKRCGDVREFYNTLPDYNPLKKNKSVLNLPKLTRVDVDKDTQS